MGRQTSVNISLRSAELTTAALPDVCARHGLAATSHQELTLTVRTKDRDDPLILNTNLPAMAGRAAEQMLQGAVRRSDWPLCQRCASIRSTNMALAKTLGVAGVLLLVAAIVLAIVSGASAIAGVLFGLGVLAFPAALVLGLRSRVAAVAQTTLSQDRTEIVIHDPDDTFVQQWRSRNG